ncbi:nuclear-interacting partner of ALK-like [Elysia marginata]|uniref:Nuclear-interacting partner of ALK-like n=1 Tax=Elysia marginata TaxID=1093978 RepID=A0AAV4GZ29_9GAST|nr:nuclear-interacting partner of ALK-like [Elysia marginata]
MAVTPEKIKSVLTSFLVKADSQETTPNNSEKSYVNKSVERNATRAVDAVSPKSITASTWFGKPAEVSPLICAQYGWENVDTDMLQCASCKAFLCGELPSRADTQAYNKSLQELKQKIVTGHDRFCMLRTFPCPEEFCHVQTDDVVSLSSSFIERVTALSEIQDQLPKLDTAALEELGYDTGQAAAYCKRNLVPDKDISPVAVTLAFAGWTCNTAANKEILVCSLCRRKIGLWNFTSQYGAACDLEESSSDEAEGSNSDDPELKVKRKKFASSPKKEALNPVEEHCHWCPWIQQVQSSTSKSSKSASLISSPPPQPVSSSKIPVFIAALKSIAPGLMDSNTGLAAGMKKSPMTQGLRCFRRALETWSSPKTSLENSQQTQLTAPNNGR